MMYKAIKGSGNPIREKAACINKDFFLFCAGHRCTFTYFFSQKNMMTDISGCICLFESAVFLEKSIIRMSGISIQLFYQLLRSTYQWEGVIRDIFIHSSASLIVFKIISKKQDPATFLVQIMLPIFPMLCDISFPYFDTPTVRTNHVT